MHCIADESVEVEFSIHDVCILILHLFMFMWHIYHYTNIYIYHTREFKLPDHINVKSSRQLGVVCACTYLLGEWTTSYYNCILLIYYPLLFLSSIATLLAFMKSAFKLCPWIAQHHAINFLCNCWAKENGLHIQNPAYPFDRIQAREFNYGWNV